MSGDAWREPSCYALLGRVEPVFVGLPGKALTRDTTRNLLFDVHAAGRLHSMLHHGCSVD